MQGILEMLTLVQKSHLLQSPMVYLLLPYEESATVPWAKRMPSTYIQFLRNLFYFRDWSCTVEYLPSQQWRTGGGGVGVFKPPSPRNSGVLTKLSLNSLKVPEIKEILLYEMKFLVPNYSCLQNPWLGGYRPQIPVLSVFNWICWTPPANKIPGYATASQRPE
jgi:hypothetical protein